MKYLIRSQIVHAFAIVVALLGVGLWLLDPDRINTTLDAYALAACLMVLYRVATLAWVSVRAAYPSPGQVMVVALFGLAVTIGGLRLLRFVGIELGIINDFWVHVAFAVLTAGMIYSLMLVVTAPDLLHGKIRLTPWGAVLSVIVGGTAINLLMAWWA